MHKFNRKQQKFHNINNKSGSFIGRSFIHSSLEKRLEANKSEIAESEDKKMNLLQEYENRIDFYRGLYEEEMKQKQIMKQQIEEEQEKMNELKQQIDILEKTNETSQQEIIQLKQQVKEEEKQVNLYEHENQSLKLTIQSLVNKVRII